MKTQSYKPHGTREVDILIAILTGHERHFWINPDLLQWCVRIPAQLRGFQGSLRFTNIHGHTPVDAARNVAVKQMLESNADWLLQIDNDTVPADGCLNVLSEIGDRKIVGFPCAGLQFGQSSLVLSLGNKAGDGYFCPRRIESTGWSEVDFMGTGCLLVHRDVFVSLSDPWFECPREVEIKERTYAGEDSYFSRKAKARGFTIWTHSSYPCKHYRTVELMQMMLDQDKVSPR